VEETFISGMRLMVKILFVFNAAILDISCLSALGLQDASSVSLLKGGLQPDQVLLPSGLEQEIHHVSKQECEE
jgi:hypothetical protein